jgi:hypothetical protein
VHKTKYGNNIEKGYHLKSPYCSVFSNVYLFAFWPCVKEATLIEVVPILLKEKSISVVKEELY